MSDQPSGRKVIFVNRYFYPDHSATSQILSDLVFALAERGWSITVIASRQLYDNPTAGLKRLEECYGVRVRRVWTSGFGRDRLLGRTVDYLSFYLTAFVALLHETHPRDIVVAKTDPPLISVVAFCGATLKRASLINWCQDLFPEIAKAMGIRGLSAPPFVFLKWLRNVSLRRAEHNVVLGESMRRRLLAEKVSVESISVISNWADGTEIFPVPSSENPLRSRWGLSDKFVVGYSGNLGRAHDDATIIGAIDKLRSDNKIAFVFIGGGARLQRIQEFVRQQELGNVLFLNYQPREQLAQSLSLPDVHLVTLRAELEGLLIPSKFYGITAAGRPIIFIGSPLDDLAAQIEEHSFGWHIQEGDAEGLAGLIRSLALQPETLTTHGLAARQTFERRYNAPHALKEWSNTLASIE